MNTAEGEGALVCERLGLKDHLENPNLNPSELPQVIRMPPAKYGAIQQRNSVYRHTEKVGKLTALGSKG